MNKNFVPCNGFEIVKRFDNSFAVYDFAHWPDSYLDSDPEANEDWLWATGGWRAKGWQVVHVASSLPHAMKWATNQEAI